MRLSGTAWLAENVPNWSNRFEDTLAYKPTVAHSSRAPGLLRVKVRYKNWRRPPARSLLWSCTSGLRFVDLHILR
jgi:hypothetical protein